MPEPAAPWRSVPVLAVEVSIVSVTARPPPLVSLVVLVPGPASSNGNLSCSVWATAEFPPAARMQSHNRIGSKAKNQPDEGYPAINLEAFGLMETAVGSGGINLRVFMV